MAKENKSCFKPYQVETRYARSRECRKSAIAMLLRHKSFKKRGISTVGSLGKRFIEGVGDGYILHLESPVRIFNLTGELQFLVRQVTQEGYGEAYLH